MHWFGKRFFSFLVLMAVAIFMAGSHAELKAGEAAPPGHRLKAWFTADFKKPEKSYLKVILHTNKQSDQPDDDGGDGGDGDHGNPDEPDKPDSPMKPHRPDNGEEGDCPMAEYHQQVEEMLRRFQEEKLYAKLQTLRDELEELIRTFKESDQADDGDALKRQILKHACAFGKDRLEPCLEVVLTEIKDYLLEIPEEEFPETNNPEQGGDEDKGDRPEDQKGKKPIKGKEPNREPKKDKMGKKAGNPVRGKGHKGPDKEEEQSAPGQPEHPDHPEHPDRPDHPEHPDHPDHPQHPEHPDHPQHPEHPEHPENPKHGPMEPICFCLCDGEHGHEAEGPDVLRRVFCEDTPARIRPFVGLLHGFLQHLAHEVLPRIIHQAMKAQGYAPPEGGDMAKARMQSRNDATGQILTITLNDTAFTGTFDDQGHINTETMKVLLSGNALVLQVELNGIDLEGIMGLDPDVSDKDFIVTVDMKIEMSTSNEGGYEEGEEDAVTEFLNESVDFTTKQTPNDKAIGRH